MQKISESFNPQSVEWRNYTDLDYKEFKINFDYSLLGYDIENGRLDMMLRYAKGNSHCRRHRHVASTLTLVLEGEQHLTELQADGTKKFIYDLWGDTVNVANRMESYGEKNHIHISDETYKLLKDFYQFEKRDKLNIDGKGSMQTYFLSHRL
mgnify:CR=1 FL=1